MGASFYSNAEGRAVISVNNPLGTSLLANQTALVGPSSQASVSGLQPGADPVAVFTDGGIFAYTYEYGRGRVYYQATHDFESNP